MKIDDLLPKILIFDIETLPNLGWTWGKWDQRVIDFEKQKCMASFAAKWLGDSKVICKGLPDYKGYKPMSYDDKALVGDLWELLDEADIVVAHHGKAYDVPFTRGRFIVHGMNPPSTFKQVDTRLLAKRTGAFNSNAMDDLVKLLGLGEKIETNFSLWLGCINGDSKSWKLMKEYNIHDVVLLEKLYLRLRPWDSLHPNVGLYTHKASCPKCGSVNIQKRGVQVCVTRSYQRFQCSDCGGWGRYTKSVDRVETTNTGAE